MKLSIYEKAILINLLDHEIKYEEELLEDENFQTDDERKYYETLKTIKEKLMDVKEKKEKTRCKK